MHRVSFIIVITIFTAHLLIRADVSATSLELYQEHNTLLFGHSFLNFSEKTMQQCLQHCLANCSCLSFQILGQQCQLCNSSKYLKPEAVRQHEEGSSFNFGCQEGIEVDNQQCTRTSCSTGINCCLTSKPCQNGGTCYPHMISSKKRFTCKCSDRYQGDQCDECKPGYQGNDCNKPIRSCRGYNNGEGISGEYVILDQSNKTFKVHCDFDTTKKIAWTLVQSYKLKNKGMIKPFYIDNPLNQSTVSWAAYRLSNSRMTTIQEDSTKWRFTCNFDTDGFNKTDSVRGLLSEVNILTFNSAGCKQVEYVNIRGRENSSCRIAMRQDKMRPLFFKPSRTRNPECELFADYKNCTIHGQNTPRREDSFGYYKCTNKAHRCSLSVNSTTQTWFGGE